MTGGSKVVGLWPRREGVTEETVSDAAPLVLDTAMADEDSYADYDDGIDMPQPDWGKRIVTTVAILAMLAWLGLIGTIYAPRWLAQPPGPDAIALAIAIASPPLVLIGWLYTLLTRNSRSRVREMSAATEALRVEQARLEAGFAHVSARLAQEHADLAQVNEQLMTHGEEALHRMKSASDGMREEIETLTRYGQSLKFSATSARADMAVLLADLPKAQVETRQMVAALQQAGITAQERASALDALLTVLGARGRETDEIARGAAETLAHHLASIESSSATARTHLDDAAAAIAKTVDDALRQAGDATETVRAGIDAQAQAVTALVDQTQSALARTGSDSAAAIAAHVDDVTLRLEALGALLGAQADQTATLLDRVRSELAGADASLTSLDETGTARAERLAAALAKLEGHASGLTGALEDSAGTADTLIARAETLLTALDSSIREIDETLPAAFDTIEARAAAAAPGITRLHSEAASALDRLIEAEALIAKQRAALDALASDTASRLTASRDAAAQLVAAVESAEATTRDLAEGAGSQLVEALVRVRETAQSASDKAREAIAAVIPQATGQLTEATREALTKVITEEVQRHIAALGTTAEAAVEAAHQASDRLMRQMLTISETSAAVEARIAEARAEVEAHDSDNFARRVALLIESLNSTAIDVTKILSNDVTDSAWAAYLRGDRGVFTRRAVRLLDAGEAREIVRHYENEPEFRDQVNRYIHDFEAMLRNVLATRDGSSLGVALLSSDMGKLYVALAQAIERLRT